VRRGALWLIAGFLVCFPIYQPLLRPDVDLLATSDGLTHTIRLYHLTFLLSRGVWWPRWVPDMFMGYGYPLFNFYAPASYYVSWALGRPLHLDIWDSYRAGYLFAVGAGFSGMFALGRRVSDSSALGALAMLCFAYQPYVFHGLIYQAGTLPELLALAAIPWLLLGVWELWHEPTERVVVGATWLTVAGGSIVVLSHNLTAVTAAALSAVLVGALLLVRRSRLALLRVTAAGALIGGLTAPFTLPAIGESHLVHLETLGTGAYFDWRNWLVRPEGREKDFAPDNRQTRTGLIDLHPIYPNQMIATPKLSLGQLTLAATTATLLAAAGLAPRCRGETATNGTTDMARRACFVVGGGLLAAAATSWFLTLTYAAPMWANVGALRLYEYPARMFGPISICLSVAAVAALGAWRPSGRDNASGRRSRASSALPLALAAVVGVNGGAERPVSYRADAPHAVDAARVRSDENSYVDVGTTGNREFLPKTIDVAEYTAGIPRLTSVYPRLYPEDDWLGGLWRPLHGDLSLKGWTALPLRMTVRVANEGPTNGELGVRQLLYPGWRAWLDGASAEIRPAQRVESQQASLGFMVVEVPPGEHIVTLAFGPTPLRLAAEALLIVTLVTTAVLVARTLPVREAWRRRVAGTFLAIGVLAGGIIAWRTAVPAFARASAVSQESARSAQPVGWQAAVGLTGTAHSAGLLNLADEAVGGRAQLLSPSGSLLGTDAFEDVRYLTVTDEVDPERGEAAVSRRRWLYMHPPSSESVEIRLPDVPGLELETALALDPAMWSAPTGDGVRFLATVTPLDAAGGTAPRTVIDQVVDPRARTEQRRWLPVVADLSPWRGQRVRITLSTEVRNDATFDWAGWAEPIVAIRSTARHPGS